MAGNLFGNTKPVEELLAELKLTGYDVRLCPGQTSPVTSNGHDFATADWYRDSKIYCIYYPKTAKAHQIYHELSHLRWGTIKQAPTMLAAPLEGQQMRVLISELNNDLDHAHVIPDEISTYPEAIEYWEADFDLRYREIDFSDQTELGRHNIKLTLLRCWLILPIAMPSSKITARFKSALELYGWFNVAQDMANNVHLAGNDKPRAIDIFRDALGLGIPHVGKIMFLPA